MKLILETKRQEDKTRVSESVAMMTFDTKDYWSYRVKVAKNQAIVCFPKLFTLGIGFENEEDWNTNLPYTSKAAEILRHIWHNRGSGNDGDAFKRRCLRAIEMIQEVAGK